MKQIFSLFLILSLGLLSLQAQETGFEDDGLIGVIYNKEVTVDLRFHTNGIFALAINKAKIKTYYRTTFYQLEIGNLRHSAESRTNDPGISTPQGFSSSSYYFGKRNSFYQVRLGYGEKRYFSEKQEHRGVAIGMSYLLGVTTGILKPYYLDAWVDSGDGNFTIQRIPYSEEHHDVFLSVPHILGSSGFKYGWNGISVMPGLHAKVGAHLDWGAYDQFVKALEFGFMLDAFYKKVPIMVSEKNKPYFLNVYLALQFGKRS